MLIMETYAHCTIHFICLKVNKPFLRRPNSHDTLCHFRIHLKCINYEYMRYIKSEIKNDNCYINVLIRMNGYTYNDIYTS